MFTGIVEAVGRVRSLEPLGGDLRLVVDTAPARRDPPIADGTGPHQLRLDDARLGESIAVAGVCLTVVEFDAGSFAADVSRETLSLTTLGRLQPGAAVNLERAMLPSTRFGGHIVAGHVDAVGSVRSIVADARSQCWRIAVPTALMRYVAVKGSIAIDGVSLTVNGLGADWLEVNLVPHTLAQTTFGATVVATSVNIEVDLVARYLERLRDGG